MADNSFFVKLGVIVDGFQKGIDKAVKSTSKLDGSFDNTQKQAKSLSTTLDGFDRTGDVFSTLTSSSASFSDKLKVIAEDIGDVADTLKNTFTKGIDGFKNLGKSIAAAFQSGVVGAKLLRTALIATGIGALLVAVGALIAYWDDIKGIVTGVSGELTRQKKLLDKQLEAQQHVVDLLKSSDNTLKLQGKTQIQINNLKIKELQTLLKIQLAELDNVRASLEGAKKREAAFVAFAEGIIDAFASVGRFIAKIFTSIGEGMVTLFQGLFAVLKPQLKIIATLFDKVFGKNVAADIDKIGASLEGLEFPDLSKGVDALANIYKKSLIPKGFLTDGLDEELKKLELSAAKTQNAIDGLKLDNIKLTPRITPENIVSPNLAQGITEGLTIADDIVTEKLSGIKEKFGEFFSDTEAITSGISSAFESLGNNIANSLSQSGGVFGAFVGTIIQESLKLLSNLITTSIKSAAIQKAQAAVHIATEQTKATASAVSAAAQTAASSGPGAAILLPILIAGAVAAIGAAFSGIGGKKSSGGGGGGFSGGASSSSGGGVSNNIGTSSSSSGSFNGRVIFEIAGDKLIGVLNNTSLGNLRVGDSDQLITTG